MKPEHRTIACLVVVSSAIVIGIITLRPATSTKPVEESELFKIKSRGKASSAEIADRLASVLQKANRAVVRINPNEGDPKGSSVEIKGAEKIQKLIDVFQAGDLNGYYDTGFEFSETISFYSDEKEVVKLGFEIPRTLRWYTGKWKGQVFLSPETSAAFCQWFDQNGYPEFEKWRTQIAEGERQERERLTRFFAAFPPATHQFLNHRISIFESDKGAMAIDPARQIVETIGSPSDAALCVFRAYGAGGKGWNGYDNIELIADSVIRVVDVESFLRALNQAKEQNDEIALLGACRYFFGNIGSEEPDYFEFIPEDQRVEWAIRLGTIGMTKAADDQKYAVRHRLEKFLPNPDVRELLEKFPAQ